MRSGVEAGTAWLLKCPVGTGRCPRAKEEGDSDLQGGPWSRPLPWPPHWRLRAALCCGCWGCRGLRPGVGPWRGLCPGG